MDGDYLERGRRNVEVREPGVLQVMEVPLGESVPEHKRTCQCGCQTKTYSESLSEVTQGTGQTNANFTANQSHQLEQ